MALHLACKQGTVKRVWALIKLGADMAQLQDMKPPDARGDVALIVASRHGHVQCVRALLSAGADPAQRNEGGDTALLLSCFKGHIDCMLALLDAGADPNQADALGHTVLMVASQCGHLEVVRELLARGADVGRKSSDGWTALMVASHSPPTIECARALLEAGADPAQDVFPEANAFEQAVLYARDLRMVQLVCAYAATRMRVRARVSILATLNGRGQTRQEITRWLETTSGWISPLHHFAFLPASRVRALLAGGADLHASDSKADSPTPLSLARELLQQRGSADERAELIVRAAGPWSPHAHPLFPAHARARAVELLLLGRQLARQRFEQAGGLVDVWVAHVMPLAVVREQLRAS
jgi:ankyrin repeat protein